MRRRLSRRQADRRRRGRRWLAVGCLLLAAVVAVAVVARVAILRTAIDTALSAQGFTDARYRIASVGLTATHLADLQLGPELAVKDLSLRYRPWQLTQLKVDEIAVTGLRMDLSAAGGNASGPLLRLLTARPPSDDAAATLELPDLPTIRVDDGEIHLPDKIVVSLDDARLTPGDGDARYEIAVKEATLVHGTQTLALDDVTAAIVAKANASELTIPFTVAALRHAVSEPMVAPLALAGTAMRAGEVWRVTASATAARKTTFAITASYDGKNGTAEGRVTLPTMRFAPGALQPGEIAPPLSALTNVTGTIQGHAGVHWRAGVVQPDGALRLDGLGFEASGVPVQDLSARLTMAGDAAQPIVRLEDTRVTLAGGELAVEDAVLRPLAESNRVVVQARAVDIGQLLAALDVKGVSGEGIVAGRIPLVLSGDAVAIEGGKLAADGAGVLRIASEQAATALAQGGDDTNLLLRALADFRYERLALAIDKPLHGESRLALNTLGHNPAVLDGHPFQINVTLTTDLDKMLGFVTTGGRLSQDVIRAIVGGKR